MTGAATAVTGTPSRKPRLRVRLPSSASRHSVSLKNGSGAVIYTRNIVTPILLLHLMLLTAGRERLDVGRMIFVYALILFGCGWLEMAARPVWLWVTNGEA